MDFTLDDDLVDLTGLASEIFADLAQPDRVRAIEASDARIDADLWAALASSGLLGLAVSEEFGGAGQGVDALAVLLTEQGRRVAPVPLWSASVASVLIDRFGSEEQRSELLSALASGEQRIALALEEYDGAEAHQPRATVITDGEGYCLNGTKAVVPSLNGADWVLVSAVDADGVPGLYLVNPEVDGVSVQISDTTMYELAGELSLINVAAQRVGDGPQVLAVALRLGAIALAATQIGVAEGALKLAADYLTNREQFGRPLGSFQAVQHQLADCWIDIDAMRVTLWQALADDADDPLGVAQSRRAERSAWVAKWWCGQAGLDVVHRVQHVHGGMGIDTDYPVHRHFLWGKQLSSTLGGAQEALAGLGELIATTEVAS